MKPDQDCYHCIHNAGNGEYCELQRIGFPHVGSWCAAFAEIEVPHEEAIQTPEAIPSDH